MRRRVRGKDAVVLPLDEVELRDVPADGDCLFHALRMEFNGCAKTSRPKLVLVGRPALPDGAALRAWYLEYIRTTDVVLDGLPVSMWLEKPVEEYCDAMRRPDVADGNTWGGFVDACIIADAVEGKASILMLDERLDGFHAIAWSRTDIRDHRRIVTLAWMETHWMRARLRQSAWDRLFAGWPI